MRFPALETWKRQAFSLVLAVVTALTGLQRASTQLARRVKDINTAVASAGSLPSKGVQIGNITYFSADDGINGSELWRSDGTTTGTWLVKDIRLGRAASNPGRFTNLSRKVRGKWWAIERVGSAARVPTHSIHPPAGHATTRARSRENQHVVARSNGAAQFGACGS
jgi:ELWxxDGT repeat protein